MRIQNGMGGMAGAGSPLVDQVDAIMEVERQPVEQVKARRGRSVQEKNEYNSLNGLLNDLGSAADGLKMPSGFKKMAFESSHPDILEGMVDGAADVGSYEFEVKGLAQADKHLDIGFPDRDKTAVGFGYMQIEREDGSGRSFNVTYCDERNMVHTVYVRVA